MPASIDPILTALLLPLAQNAAASPPASAPVGVAKVASFQNHFRTNPSVLSDGQFAVGVAMGNQLQMAVDQQLSAIGASGGNANQHLKLNKLFASLRDEGPREPPKALRPTAGPGRD